MAICVELPPKVLQALLDSSDERFGFKKDQAYRPKNKRGKRGLKILIFTPSKELRESFFDTSDEDYYVVL